MSQQPREGQVAMIDRILAGRHGRVLDVGAGDGKWGKLLRGVVPHIAGLEVWPPYILKYGLRSVYDVVIESNVMDFTRFDEYNVIIFGDVLEHLKRDDALAVIDRIKTARVFLTIPISMCVQDGTVYNNPYETHLDNWSHDDLLSVGWRLLHRGFNEAGTVEIGTYELEKCHG